MGRKTTGRSSRRSSASTSPPTETVPPSRRGRAGARPQGAETTRDLPTEELRTSTGTARLVPDPDGSTGVTLLVNGVPSSHLDLADPGLLTFEYMQQMAAVLAALPPGPLRVVHLGAAGCTFARYVEHERPDSRQVAVDLDADLVTRVREWFALPRAPRLRLRAGDARAELATLADASADVVVRDVFAGDTTPEHVTTTAFVRDVLRVLRPGGLYLANCADRPPLALARAELATAVSALAASGSTDRDVWDEVGLIAEPGQLKGRRYGNLVLVAVRGAAPTVAGSSDTSAPAGLDLRDAGLARTLRSLPVPATLLTGEEARRFAGTAAPLEDPPVPGPPTDPEPSLPPADATPAGAANADGRDVVGHGKG
ncbi:MULTISPECIES: spermidine synthase [Oerskovia]|uniref:Fused MFS/spermidine synthase n=1 Tax=Oerskovia gallyi TaxID=2762226 RepID=A0ABR8V2I7_9CELL|nr:fused MFS/spermidine synthase [Oerskovia gallyi]MBD7998989.1 fused MFS/spermidine synthase [Oerskovia gallyi]